MNLDLVTAVLMALASVSIFMRQIVLSPRNETYPGAPAHVRFAMFVFAAFCAAAAVMFQGSMDYDGHYAGSAAPVVALFVAGVALYNAVMMVNVMAQRYPPAVWRRMNRAAEAVRRSCPEKKMAVPAPLHVPSR